MENSQEDNSKKEPNKTICNRCMSDMTGINDVSKNNDGFDMDMDLSTIIEHMEFALAHAAGHMGDGEISTAMIFHTYLSNDIDMLKMILDINNECECCKEHGNDEEED